LMQLPWRVSVNSGRYNLYVSPVTRVEFLVGKQLP
jgi:hypothetical protein